MFTLCLFLFVLPVVLGRQWCDMSLTVDAIFLLDESGSVSEKNFKDYVIPFTKTFSKELHNAHPSSHIGIIKYSTIQKYYQEQEYCIGATKYAHFPDVKLVHPLDGNYAKLVRDVSNMKYKGGFTPTGHALKEANDELVRHGREDVPKFVILITDGDPRCDVKGGKKADDPSFAYEQANILKDRKDAILIIVEVGSAIKHDVDLAMASNMPDGGSYVFGVEDYASLLRIVDTVLAETCFELEEIRPNITCNTTKGFTFDVIGSALTKDQEVTCRLVARGPTPGTAREDKVMMLEGKGDILDIHRVRCALEKKTTIPEGIYDLFISFDSGEFLDTEITLESTFCPPSEEVVDPSFPKVEEGIIGTGRGSHWAVIVGPIAGTLLCCCLLLTIVFILILLCLLCYVCQYDLLEKLSRRDLSGIDILKIPLQPTVDEPVLDPELEDIQIEDENDLDDLDDDDLPIPDPPRQHPVYYINGRPVNVDWGTGLSIDTPFRGSDMGMGASFSKKTLSSSKSKKSSEKKEETEGESEMSDDVKKGGEGTSSSEEKKE